MTTRLVVGCMTGTSVDGVDAALVEISGRGLSMTAELRQFASCPLGELAAPLRALSGQQVMTAGEIASLSHEFEQLHVRLLRELSVELTCPRFMYQLL